PAAVGKAPAAVGRANPPGGAAAAIGTAGIAEAGPCNSGNTTPAAFHSGQSWRQTSVSAVTRPSLIQLRNSSPTAGPYWLAAPGGITYHCNWGASAIGSTAALAPGIPDGAAGAIETLVPTAALVGTATASFGPGVGFGLGACAAEPAT